MCFRWERQPLDASEENFSKDEKFLKLGVDILSAGWYINKAFARTGRKNRKKRENEPEKLHFG